MLNRIQVLLALLVIAISPLRGHAEEDLSCVCPKATCNLECEYEESVSFYSEKCAGGAKVKSCAKPKCIAIPNQPLQCTAPKKTDAGAAQASNLTDSAKRDVASVAAVKVGTVDDVMGKAWSVNGKKKLPLEKGVEVFQSDRIETGPASKVTLVFSDDNTVVVTENSVLELSQFNFNEDITKRNTLLNLMKGKVRSSVKQKYTGKEQSFYQVKTSAAVAGVRGTDFVVSIDDSKDDLITRVETVHGEVEFQSQIDTQSRIISKEQTAEFVLRGGGKYSREGASLSTADWRGKAIMSEVAVLDKNRIARIDEEMAFAPRVAKAEKVASGPICNAPQADFNQCAWKCENNPKGEARCRTDLPHVNCVRRVCNANGQWSDSARLPASFSNSCDPEKTVVGSCDY